MRLILAIAMAAISPQDEDPVVVLMRLRDRIMDQRARMPNHTCVETIVRDRYRLRTGPSRASCDAILGRRKRADLWSLLRLETTDRLRLDVGLSRDREMYSWPGARQFSSTEIYDFTPAGAFGTGPFASLLLSLFDSATPEFSFDGETTRDVQRLFEYSFSRAREESHLHVRAGTAWLITGYSAILLVDPRTSDLVRLTVRTEELPPATSLCELDTTLDYGSVPLNGSDYLVPVAARQRFILSDGSEGENRVSYGSCRDFQAESQVHFGSAEAGDGSPPDPGPARVRLRPGLAVNVEIVKQIDGGTAAAGDRVEGRLAKSVGGIPAGARLEGRLLQVQTRHGTPPEVSFALRWETIETDGVRMAIALAPRRRPGQTIDFPLKNEDDYDVYHFRRGRPMVPSGFRTEWLSVQP